MSGHASNSKAGVLLRCPECNKKMWFHGAAAHRKDKHPNISFKDFETMIIEAIKNGSIQPRHFGAVDPHFVSSTQRLSTEKKYNKLGIRSVVSGGKFGRSDVNGYLPEAYTGLTIRCSRPLNRYAVSRRRFRRQ